MAKKPPGEGLDQDENLISNCRDEVVGQKQRILFRVYLAV
jgi:hypothetical protein